MKIIDDNCNEVSRGQEGNIAVYCDPNKQQGGLFAGYVDNEEMTKKVFSNNFYFTGVWIREGYGQTETTLIAATTKDMKIKPEFYL